MTRVVRARAKRRGSSAEPRTNARAGMAPSQNQLRSWVSLMFVVCSLAVPNVTQAQGSDERANDGSPEHTIIVGVGGAAEVELGPGSLHPGASAFVEYEAVERWLELELGVQVLAADGGREAAVDLLFKKPFSLGRRWELMIGVGPEVVSAVGGNRDGTFFGGEVAFDFMFWPSRRVGFWGEPTYELVAREGASHSLGWTGGVIIGW